MRITTTTTSNLLQVPTIEWIRENRKSSDHDDKGKPRLLNGYQIFVMVHLVIRKDWPMKGLWSQHNKELWNELAKQYNQTL